VRHTSGKALLAAILFVAGVLAHAAQDAAIAIGDIGKLKRSHTIVQHVTARDGAQPPPLLPRASYVTYADGLWQARNAPDSAPTAGDLQLADKEREAYAAVAAELGLSAQTAASSASIERVKYFFATAYQYAPYQKTANDTTITGSPMVDFLHRSKAGHCEYFATATALLLRAGGIPARYATGFAVSEKSPQRIAGERIYVVRERHAHAWVRAYVNGAWVDVDTTPPVWIAAEAQDGGWWVAVADHWSWLRFRASQQSLNEDPWVAVIGGCVMFLLVFWLWRRLYRRRTK
jgi:hypothetical protein